MRDSELPPEWRSDLDTLGEEALEELALQLERELDAPQTNRARERRQAALERIRGLMAPRSPSLPRRFPTVVSGTRSVEITVETRRSAALPSTPERALDALMAFLDGWNVDWTDAGEVEQLAVPQYDVERMVQIVARALREGELARRPAEDADPTQLVLPLRRSA